VARTSVGIIGAGPAGMVLAHLLAKQGVECVVLEQKSRAYVEKRVRAGLLEHGTVALLEREGLGDRMRERGAIHRGVELRFDRRRVRIPYGELYGGRHMMVYAQQELVADLIRHWLARNGALVFEAEDARIEGVGSERPVIAYQVGGRSERLECDYVAGCDGFHGISRASIPAESLRIHDHHLPLAWVGILAQVAPSTEEIIYAQHDHGFAGHMLRTASVSRFYLETVATDQIASWPDERIWEELQLRLSTDDGWKLREGPILEKNVTEMRSFVCEPMQYGRLFLAGDAAHIVPPTGAKGLNLAVADARVLAEALGRACRARDASALEVYTATCLRRVWRVQEFSLWMTWLLHKIPDAWPDAALRRKLQRSQLEYLASSPAAGASFSENYVGIERV
jgi:p-hydroxybenzoate 3-monooxygenase